MITIAVDAGKTGAIAIRYEGGDVVVVKMPENRYEIQDFFKNISICIKRDGNKAVAIIEQLHAGSAAQGFKKGVKQIWSQSANYSDLMCALYNAGIKTIEVSPQKWMGKVTGTRPKEYKERKSWLHEQAKMTFPDLKAPKYAADALMLLHVSSHFIFDNK
jgi:hypothetical protein